MSEYVPGYRVLAPNYDESYAPAHALPSRHDRISASTDERLRTMVAKRIQRKRTKGWQMPDGVVYVGRPGVWGNPYSDKWFLRFHFDVQLALSLFRATAQGCWLPNLSKDLQEHVQKMVYEEHCEWLKRQHRVGAHIGQLRGADLACWCRLDQPCHADVLLELANR